MQSTSTCGSSVPTLHHLEAVRIYMPPQRCTHTGARPQTRRSMHIHTQIMTSANMPTEEYMHTSKTRHTLHALPSDPIEPQQSTHRRTPLLLQKPLGGFPHPLTLPKEPRSPLIDGQLVAFT